MRPNYKLWFFLSETTMSINGTLNATLNNVGTVYIMLRWKLAILQASE